MNLRFTAILTVVVSVFVPIVANAGNATWDLNPSSGDWNTPANWTPTTVPSASTDTATFNVSNATGVSISANTAVNGITFTSAARNPYTIAAASGVTLTLSGTGIVNNSGTMQNFTTDVHFGFFLFKGIAFTGSATAGSLTRFTNSGATGVITPTGGTTFFNTSSASNGIFVNEGNSTSFAGGGQTLFFDASTAANGTFTNNGGLVVGGYGAETIFSDNSTGASGTFTNNPGTVSATSVFPSSLGGLTVFRDNSTAGSGVFTNNGHIVSNANSGGTAFYNTSTAANGTFINNGAGAHSTTESAMFPGGGTGFNDSATAGNGTFINNGGIAPGGLGGDTGFGYIASAGNGVFINNGAAVSGAGGGFTEFRSTFNSTPTAANGTFTNGGGTAPGAGGGYTEFLGNSTAASATLIAKGGTNGGNGGAIFFGDNSTLGKSRIEIFGNGALDISLHSAPGMTINSIEGDGIVFLGANNLTVGSNNKDTTFSCAIQDGGQGGGVGGSLTKLGSGTLILSGANTYTGNTNINGGVVQVAGSTTSNTFVNSSVLQVAGSITGNANLRRSLLQLDGSITGNISATGSTIEGTGTVNGDVMTLNSTIKPGDSPGTLTVNGNYTQPFGTLMIDIAGPSAGQYSVLNVLGTANLRGFLDPVLLNGFVPTIGESFTFLDYGAVTGSLHIFDRNIDNVAEHWDVTYQSTDAILTVESGNVSIPDHGSTLPLLMLGLLGLVTYRRSLQLN